MPRPMKLSVEMVVIAEAMSIIAVVMMGPMAFRDDVLHDYAHDAAALDAHGLNVLLVYELEHLRPHQAHLLRDERDGDDEHQVHVCRRHHSRQRYHQYQDRQAMTTSSARIINMSTVLPK